MFNLQLATASIAFKQVENILKSPTYNFEPSVKPVYRLILAVRGAIDV